MRNVECKAVDPSLDRTRQLCAALRAEDGGTIWQHDTYFDVARGRLKLREERPGRPHLIQYARADEPQQRESRYRLELEAVATEESGLARERALVAELRGGGCLGDR